MCLQERRCLNVIYWGLFAERCGSETEECKNEWSKRHFKGRLQSDDIFHLIKNRESCFCFVISYILVCIFANRKNQFPKTDGFTDKQTKSLGSNLFG